MVLQTSNEAWEHKKKRFYRCAESCPTSVDWNKYYTFSSGYKMGVVMEKANIFACYLSDIVILEPKRSFVII